MENLLTNSVQVSVANARRSSLPYGRRKTRRFLRAECHKSPPSGVFVTAPEFTEWHLVQQGIAGDSTVLDQLFSVHRPRLQRMAYAILRNKEDAEDALQEGLCNAYVRLRSFQGRSSLSTWLTRVIINSTLMIRRKRNRRPETSLDDVLENHSEQLQNRIVDPALNPEQTYRRTEMNHLVAVQVSQLPPALRSAFQLYDLDGRSTAESAAQLSIPIGALKSRLVRARRRVANGLSESLIAAEGYHLRQSA